jgi:hypothetical protein
MVVRLEPKEAFTSADQDLAADREMERNGSALADIRSLASRAIARTRWPRSSARLWSPSLPLGHVPPGGGTTL